MAIQVNTIQSLPHVKILGEFSSPITGVSIDTRTLNAGELFVAFSGAQVDGHDFIPNAISRGASAVMASTNWDGQVSWAGSIPLILTEDPVKTLADLAHAHRMLYDLPVIAVTGTNGKTSTKNLLAHILKKNYLALSTSGNYNNHIGLPVSLLSLDESHSFAVLEMGASRQGDIKYLCEIAAPTQGVITNVSMAHTEFFHDLETIQSTKGELFDYLDAHNGQIFVNGDDPRVAEHAAQFEDTLSFAFSEDSDYRYQLGEPDALGCYSLTFDSHTIQLRHPGKALALNAAAAMTLALENCLNVETVVDALQDYPGESGRMQLIQADGVHFIHDAYNANPASTQLGIETMKSIQTDSRKIMVFADMLELGEQSGAMHQAVGDAILEADFDFVFMVGVETIQTSQHLDINNFTACYHNVDKAATIQRFLRFVSDGDLVYLKGSRGMKLEDFIEAYKERK